MPRKKKEAPNYITFPIYFSQKKSYLKVFIWKSFEVMNRECKGSDPPPCGFIACFVPEAFPPPERYKDDKGEIRVIIKGSNKHGELHFSKEHISAAIVAHEILHGVFDLIYKMREVVRGPSPFKTRTRQDEMCEYYCHEMETLTRGFWRRYWNRLDKIKNL